MKYGIRWMEFNMKDQLVTKQKFFETAEARAKFADKISDKSNFHSILAYCED